MEHSAVDFKNEFLYLTGTGEKAAVVGTRPFEDIPSMDYVPKNLISVIKTNVLKRLGFSCEINYQNIGE